MTVSIRETPEFVRGEQFERALSRLLQSRGWGVVPVYNYDGGENKPPKMERANGSLVLPDLFAAKAGVSLWCEAKRKSSTSFTFLTRQPETGIDARLFAHYGRVKLDSGIDVWLFFGHDAENEVRFCELEEFEPRHSPKFNGGRGGYFWPWESLHLLCALDELWTEAA